MNELKMAFSEADENRILSKILENFGQEVFTPGLERSAPLYQFFLKKIEAENIKVITVAGTNGKGQTCHYISKCLKQKNISSSLWTSPHILSIRERFVYCDIEIDYGTLEKIIDQLIPEILNLDFKVSFYEFLFYVYLKWIFDKKVEVLILEVGLGGRFDAVNHFNADYALITSISRDHQLILGNRYDLILMEKLGVTRTNKVLLTSFKLKYLIELTENYAKKVQFKYKNVNPVGNYFQSNENLANEVLKNLGIEINSHTETFAFKGRLEKSKWYGNQFQFIGAHNPDGVRELFSLFKDKNIEFDFYLVSFSKRDDSDIRAMMKMLLANEKYNRPIKLCFFDHPKAINREILEDVTRSLCHNNKIELIPNWKTFLNGIKNPTQQNKILVIGSYYFIGEVQRFIEFGKQ